MSLPGNKNELIKQFDRGREFRYDKKASIFNAIAVQIQKNPKCIALQFENQTVTYGELDRRINQAAAVLLSQKVKPFDRIAIYLEPSIETVLVILAVIKIGASYVPLDTTYPLDRLNFMLSDCGASLLITQSNLKGKLAAISKDHTLLVNDLFCQDNLIDKKVEDLASGNNIAYIIYTSGSTGKPKGVEVRHQSVNNHMCWMQDHFKLGSEEKILLKTPLSFDPSVWEIFLPLYMGATLVIAPEGTHLDAALLVEVIIKYEITIVQLVPSLLFNFLNEKNVSICHSLKHVFCGGESLTPKVKELFFNTLSAQLHNLYGPTEATIEVTSYTFQPTFFDIQTNLIGRPIYNVQLYVVNGKKQLSSIGEEGELYVTGDCLAQGYFNNQKITDSKFVANPFDPEIFPKMYRTGDIVKWLEPGVLEYIGRRDGQFKINGARVDIGEIVTTVLKCKAIQNCVVIKSVDAKGNSYFICYFVVEPSLANAFNVKTLKNLISQELPSYMQPKFYVPISEIPLSPNGKIDEFALPAPSNTILKTHVDSDAKTQEEKRLLKIWQKVLDTQNIQVEDNFFEVGGFSLIALKLLMEIKKEFGVLLHVRDIFLYPTVKMQAQLLHDLSQSPELERLKAVNPVIALQLHGSKTPLFLIHPIGGTVFWYSTLAKEMGEDRPIYGIQDPGVELEVPIFNSIEEIAQAYVIEIKKIQPAGPYIIGGASFGATVAIEIANLLNASGDEILTIPILDGWGVYPEALVVDDSYFIGAMKRQHLTLEKEFKKYGLKSDNLLKVQWHRLNLLWSYHLKPIKYPLALFKSMEILPVFLEIDAPLNHWDKFAEEFKITCFHVPGNHETMFQPPNVQVLAKQLQEYLRSIEKNHNKGIKK